ncbi:MAG: aminotransferase class I/II-fold pyridoxal phosphate-dependent enzyme [Candidatus Staskawiczbacteria bacterium]|nr:aminotransferase class I/II-fold pyridoxal phosphate-dependent enzyme [Candidatus Staskawiczbacteria bacterium]
MKNKFKPISISLSPNIEPDDVRLALNLIIRPWLWRKGLKNKESGINKLEEEFKRYLGVKYAFSFNSGRSAFFAILKTLGLDKNRHVFLQAFTCNAVVNPVLWAGLNPVYIDCDKDSFNIDIEDLEKKINSLKIEGKPPRVLVIQHTFGLPSNMDILMPFARKNNLIVIEDCAHSLGSEFKGQKVGTFGKAAFFSFSRDKVISSVYGGIAVTNDDRIGQNLKRAQADFGMPSRFWIFQQILHPIFLNYVVLPIYAFLDLGKIFLVLSQWLNILSKAVHWKEKRGLRPDYFPKAMPNALAVMALNQFLKLDKFYRHRKSRSRFYYDNLKGTSFSLHRFSSIEELSLKNIKHSFLRFTVRHKRAHEIIYEAWHNQNILLGDWYTTPIAPHDTNMKDMKYKKGSCKNAEELAKTTLNLPTHINISQKDEERIINFLKKF